MFLFQCTPVEAFLDPGRQPAGWSGLDPILYWSLDNLDGLLFMEGNAQREYDALTEGKVSHRVHDQDLY